MSGPAQQHATNRTGEVDRCVPISQRNGRNCENLVVTTLHCTSGWHPGVNPNLKRNPEDVRTSVGAMLNGPVGCSWDVRGMFSRYIQEHHIAMGDTLR